MPKLLYADFLESKSVYNLAQGFWNKLITSLVASHGYTHRPYINQQQGGKKEYDGNPIFSAYIPKINKAIRIIQVSPEEEGDDISAWIDNVELPKKKKAIQELVIDIKLTQQAKRLAKQLIELWVTGKLTDSLMSNILDNQNLPSSNHAA